MVSSYKQSWKRMLKNCGHSMKWMEPAANLMLLARIKKRANTFFVIVQPKARKVAEAFATTLKRLSQEKKINLEITRGLFLSPLDPKRCLNFAMKM
jgi:hypothetical protein